MTRHHVDLMSGLRHDLRRLAHRAILGLERPENELVRTRGGEPLAIVAPVERTHALGITLHPHVLAVDDAPAVQRRFLHRGDKEAPIGTESPCQMRALPFETLGFACDIREPKRCAIVMRNGEPKPLGRESKPADSRGYLQ